MASGSLITKEEIVKALLALNGEDFAIVLCTVAKENPHPDKMSYITNKFQQHRKSKTKDATKSGKDLSLFQRPEQPTLKPGRDGRSSRALESSPYASLLPDIHGVSAWQVPMIFRGDLVPKHGKLYLDIEKLAMKTGWLGGTPFASKQKHKQVGNNIAVVDEKGVLVFWAFVYRNPEDICQYMTSIHRINRAKILGGVQITTVRDLLEKCFKGNTVVGAKLKDDLKALSLESEFSSGAYFTHDRCFDLQDFFVDQQQQPINLKDLVAHFFPEKAKNFQSGCHSAVSDARMTMQLFLKMNDLKLQDSTMTDTSYLDIPRTKKKYIHDPRDICRCNRK